MKQCYHCMHQIEKETARFCPQCRSSLAVQPVSEQYLQPGTILQGRFLVGYTLGVGGFGNTYIGWDQKLLRKVAVKEFYPKQYCCRDADRMTVTVTEEKQQERFQAGLRQFLEEARNVAALKEIPGIVEISSYFEENKTGYIVMEYLEGMDVKHILSRTGGRKDYEWCRRVVLTVLYTLRELHNRGVIHRDIAPDNVFVTREGIIKLIDFGAAKHVSALSDTGSEIMLKAGYAPIEQYSRTALQGPYTDLYAVAALFYRMLTGQRPVAASERLEQDGLISPSDMGIAIPEQAEMGIMVCLNVQPEYRLQSADEFMEALDGKYYIPVYEPEWILPPMEEKQETGKGRKAGFCLGGIGLAVLMALGISRFTGRGAQQAGLADEAVIMNDLTGMTEDEAAASIEALEEKARQEGIILDLGFKVEGYVFDPDKDKNGTVVSQTIKPSFVFYDPGAESQKKLEGLKRDKDGNISGTVSCRLYRNTKIRYSDISGLNVYAMAQKLGIDTGDQKHFTGTSEVEDSCYYDLVRLETPDGKISPEELREKKNRKKEITYRKGQMRIIYSNIPFFYWESLPDFQGAYGTLEGIPEQDTYIWKNETEREPSGQKKTLQDGRGMVDGEYCVIPSSESRKGHRKGDILHQTVPPGEELDTSRTKPEGGLLYVAGYEIFYSGKTGNQLKEELTSQWGENIHVEAGGSRAMDQPVLSVTITDENGTAVDYFRKGAGVTVVLNLRAAPTPVPQPDYSDAGGYTGGTYSGGGVPAGGGYSGGGSAGANSGVGSSGRDFSDGDAAFGEGGTGGSYSDGDGTGGGYSDEGGTGGGYSDGGGTGDDSSFGEGGMDIMF